MHTHTCTHPLTRTYSHLLRSNPQVVTELRARHARGEKNAGINVRRGGVTDMLEESVVQPLLVSASAVGLASECVRMILKIDDIVPTR